MNFTESQLEQMARNARNLLDS